MALVDVASISANELPAGVQQDAGANNKTPTAAIAVRLLDCLPDDANGSLIHVEADEGSASEIAEALASLIPDERAEIVLLPPWDCLPYDRVWPSRESMGRRMVALRTLAQPQQRPRVLIVSIEAAIQRVPGASAIAKHFMRIAVGQRLDRDAIMDFAMRTGYILDDRVDEPGEIAFLRDVIDVFPAGDAQPARILCNDDGVVTELHLYDPLSQRTERELQDILLGPASEVVLSCDAEPAPDGAQRGRTMEERILAHCEHTLVTVFDYLPDAALSCSDNVDEQMATLHQLIAEANASRHGGKNAADKFYLSRKSWDAMQRNRSRLSPALGGLDPVPAFFRTLHAGKALGAFAKKIFEQKMRLVIAGSADDIGRAARLLRRSNVSDFRKAVDWSVALRQDDGAVILAPFLVTEGFIDHHAGVAVVSSADIFGTRTNEKSAAGLASASLDTEPELRIGDVVIHEDRGVGVLRALETVEVAGQLRDTVRLEYHGGASLLAGVEDFGRIWRYGGSPDAVKLDRLNGESWIKRRQTAMVEIDRVANHLIETAYARSKTMAATIKPPRAAYAHFAARFPYPETPDQAAAIEAVLTDLGSGIPMNRLICGDVGFGKTEISLRAAAAAALAGKQVVLVAPTTVLVRQHFETFSRRFAGTNVKVGHLSRVAESRDIRSVKQGLAAGDVQVVVATHAILNKDITFADLGLVIIDEEHRFGAAHKTALRNLSKGLHALTMSATPIPRTLLSAMAGIQDVSLLVSPPAKRRPIRTSMTQFDPDLAKSALLRERQRGGQSFVVVPRIEDIDPLADKLARLIPDLTVRIAHGGMKPAELDTVIVSFAAGDGDVLLATNIIESGLDVPRANTMLVWRADRFGLAQLHQLRGRVGRGKSQGIAYLLTDPKPEIAKNTTARLSKLVAFDRLGSGLAISGQDLDLRGAGDIVGDNQAGHIKLIGVGLYQKLLARAVAIARGESVAPEGNTELKLEMSGAFPSTYIPEPGIRLNLYARLQRLADEDEIDSFADELEDRFGNLPEEVETLIDLARLRCVAIRAGVKTVEAGPNAIAISFREHSYEIAAQRQSTMDDCELRGDRLVFARPTTANADRIAVVREVLENV